MSDLSVNDAEGIVLIQALEERFAVYPVIVTNEDGEQESKALIPLAKSVINKIPEEE